ncbi:MAG: ABC transporter ATP-binding protein, partial [Bacilli bacterium]
MAEILTVENLSHFYQDGDRKKYVLKDVSYEFKTGTFYAIVGASGSGKTTFLSLISGLDTLKSGQVSLNGHNIEDIGLSNYRCSRVGIVFQSYNLIKYLTARENVLLAMETTTNKMPKDKDQVVTNLLDYLGISKDKINRQVNQLSGGEQQRVAIARALASDVNFIF